MHFLLVAFAFANAFALAAAVTRYRPSYGLAALIVVDPFAFEQHLFITTVTLPKVVLFGVTLGLVLKKSPLTILWTPQVRLLLGGFVAIFVATTLTAIPGLYIDAVARESLKSLEYLMLFVVAVVAFIADPSERVIWAAIAGTCATVCVLALGEEIFGTQSAAFIGGHIVRRIAGPLDGPNQLAGYLEIALSMLLAQALTSGSRSLYLCFVFAVVVDVLTLSRAGLVGLIVGIVAVVSRLAGRIDARKIVIASVTVAAGAGALLVHLGALEHIFSISDVDFDTGLGSRNELWSAAIQFFLAHPLLGIGAGNFELQLPTLGIIGVRTHANSLYLQSLAEGGIVLLAANITTIAIAIVTLYFARERRSLTVGAGAATIALAAHQFLDTMTFFPKVGGFWCLVLGIAAASTMEFRMVGRKG